MNSHSSSINYFPCDKNKLKTVTTTVTATRSMKDAWQAQVLRILLYLKKTFDYVSNEFKRQVRRYKFNHMLVGFQHRKERYVCKYNIPLAA